MKKVKLHGKKLEVKFDKYENGRTAISFYQDREPYLTATVNLPKAQMASNHVAIKDYGENVGVLAALQNAGIVGGTLYYHQTGFVNIPIVELLDENTEPEEDKSSEVSDYNLDNTSDEDLQLIALQVASTLNDVKKHASAHLIATLESRFAKAKEEIEKLRREINCLKNQI